MCIYKLTTFTFFSVFPFHANLLVVLLNERQSKKVQVCIRSIPQLQDFLENLILHSVGNSVGNFMKVSISYGISLVFPLVWQEKGMSTSHCKLWGSCSWSWQNESKQEWLKMRKVRKIKLSWHSIVEGLLWYLCLNLFNLPSSRLASFKLGLIIFSCCFHMIVLLIIFERINQAIFINKIAQSPHCWNK